MASKANELEPEENQTPARALEKTAQFCSSQFTVWTSMLQRSMQTAEDFDPDDYDVKHIRFLNEINSGVMYLFYLQIYKYLSNICPTNRFVKECHIKRFKKNIHKNTN